MMNSFLKSNSRLRNGTLLPLAHKIVPSECGTRENAGLSLMTTMAMSQRYLIQFRHLYNLKRGIIITYCYFVERLVFFWVMFSFSIVLFISCFDMLSFCPCCYYYYSFLFSKQSHRWFMLILTQIRQLWRSISHQEAMDCYLARMTHHYYIMT